MSNLNGYSIERGAPFARNVPSDLRAPHGGAKPAIKPSIFSMAELQRQEFPEIRYIVPGYIAEGCTLLAGRPKLGKSWLVLEMGLAVASGESCLGGIPCEQGDVLYLALEDNKRRLQRRGTKMLGAYGGNWPAAMECATEWPRASEGGIEAIEEWILSKQNPRLIIIDVFAQFKTERASKDSLYEADYRSVKALQTLAGKYQVAIIVVSHTRKSNGTEADPFEKVSGTLGLSGAADTTFILDRDGNGASIYLRGRDIEETNSAVIFDTVSCRWHVQGDANEVRRTDERGAILGALDEANEPMSPGDIALATRMSSLNVRQLLFKMTKAGEVSKTGRGFYQHPGRQPYDNNASADNNDNKITTVADEQRLPSEDRPALDASQTGIAPKSDVTDNNGTAVAETLLTKAASDFLAWLRSRTEQPVSARLITSHAPKHIRAQQVRDPVLAELQRHGLIRIEETKAANASRTTRLIHLIGEAGR
ncbi:AAA family ATPase [Methylobacterium sp. J-078]|uniref:AAA family ATPase n=1 Tax=Methylobacterium sp. J-078 TaxID=2836657 RepID=UPI001FBBF8F8|nr:AAA family ATPase [Methylobacterium sp. J-078]MCJ2044739.1 AAA family ATPase [Methylobacterium sp. J-078]